MNRHTHDAVRCLYPDAITIFGDSIEDVSAHGAGGNTISIDKDAVLVKINELKNSFPNLPYQQSRAAAYPSIQDQLDMIWHTIASGKNLDKSSEFFKSIESVKLEFPKS